MSTLARSRTESVPFGEAPASPLPRAWAGQDSNLRVGCSVYSRVRSPLRHRPVGWKPGIDPGPGGSQPPMLPLHHNHRRSGRTRTCAPRFVGPPLCR
jgi:hypothetical protein